MAKAKKKKAQKGKGILEPDVMVYIYSLAAIAVSLIGCLQIGFAGSLLTSLLQYLCGTLYGVVYAVVIVTAFLAMMRKSWKQLPAQYLVAAALFVTAWMILASIPSDETLKGAALLNDYLRHTALILQGEVSRGGGVIGVLLVSLLSFLFDHTGTRIVAAAMILMGIALCVHGTLSARLRSAKDSLGSAWQARRKAPKPPCKDKEEPRRVPDIRIDDGPVDTPSFFVDADDAPVQKVEQPPLFAQEEEDHLDIMTPQKKHEEKLGILADGKEREAQEDKKAPFTSQFDIDYSKYRLPRLSLLDDPAAGKKSKANTNVQAARLKGKQLIDILEQFGVKATLVGTHIGPSITRFEVRPDQGVRVSRISNLQYDIKMALAAKDIRIEAPIPGKSAVGIEVPNEEKTTVRMKELMRAIPESMATRRLLFCLGKDLSGSCVYGELNKMPHLLVAGATGSGKSVCINSIICSLLMRTRPDEVKMLLIDPKKVEFTPYHEVPHLIGPVITDSEEANRALKVIVAMMDQRYELFAMAGVRNISGYNAMVNDHPEEQREPLPSVVVIIDELADLMMVAAKEVEGSIQRITQLARAAGIHLIVATQRPSVDVITGVIKANIPSRIAFSVSSAVDSRTILDQMGAEKLLGYGDMLYLPVGETAARRIQGVYVDDKEVARICEAVKKQGRPRYDDAFLRLDQLDSSQGGKTVEIQEDPLYDEVREFVIHSRKASTSLIQRRFSIGYARAARLIDVLEERGIIGPARGSKPREVFVREEDEQ